MSSHVSEEWLTLREAAEAFASDEDKEEHRHIENLNLRSPHMKDWYPDKSTYCLYKNVVSMLKSGALTARGRVGDLKNPTQDIPSYFWNEEAEFPAGKTDEAIWPGVRNVYKIRVCETSALKIKKNERNAGRQPKYDWDVIIDKLMIKLTEEGMPDTQEQLVLMIESVCDENSTPARQTIIDHFQKYPRFLKKCTKA